MDNRFKCNLRAKFKNLFKLEQACLGLKLTTAAASKLEEKPIKKQNKKKKKLSFADDHGQPLFTGE